MAAPSGFAWCSNRKRRKSYWKHYSNNYQERQNERNHLCPIRITPTAHMVMAVQVRRRQRQNLGPRIQRSRRRTERRQPDRQPEGAYAARRPRPQRQPRRPWPHPMSAMENAASVLALGMEEAQAFIEDCQQRRQKLSDELGKQSEMAE